MSNGKGQSTPLNGTVLQTFVTEPVSVPQAVTAFRQGKVEWTDLGLVRTSATGPLDPGFATRAMSECLQFLFLFYVMHP